MQIITNNHHRDIEQNGQDEEHFIYKGEKYYLNDFSAVYDEELQSHLKGWDGVLTETFFSAIIVKFVDDNCGVVVGRYYT